MDVLKLLIFMELPTIDLPLRKVRLWRRVVGERPGTRHSRGKGRPVLFLLGILLLSGDVELNPGPKTRSMTTRAAGKGIGYHTTTPWSQHLWLNNYMVLIILINWRDHLFICKAALSYLRSYDNLIIETDMREEQPCTKRPKLEGKIEQNVAEQYVGITTECRASTSSAVLFDPP